ncbi:Ide [Symbiodinium sp. CCMP2592]|nr:Ide [Symbiodinium sp. CCMP2592]
MKSPLDIRNYRALTLGNGMRVLLASDPDAVTASSALSVHVGFYSDPEDTPGLAHFCEHMLFLGTKEYPEENSFESFLVANSGSQNAFTSESSTTYFFEVSPSGLRESLQRFASFFREPLFTASATEREVNAISSEFAKNQENDGFRFQQLLKGTASKGHPERHFGCGNRKTLVESRGPEQLRESLQTFFEAYDPAAMSLCIVGKEPLDVLQASTEAYFGSIPQRRLADRPWKSLDPYPPRLSRGTPLIVEAVPVSEARSVSLTWTITFPDRKAREEFLVAKPADYISQILGHEGPGSLQSLLKRKGWANKTIAGVVFDQDDFSIFKVGFDVSEEGLRQKEALYGAVFSVLRQMQERGMDAVPDYSIQETRELAELRWRFAEKPRSQQATLEAVEAMEDRLSPATYLSNRVLLFDPPEDGPNKGSLKRAIFGLLQQLTPERARYATFARENAGKAKQTETWYGVKYAETELQKSAFTGWSTRPTADLLEGWSYPKPNPFIPKDFDLAWPQASSREKAAASSRPPELIRKDDRWRVFFKADQSFGVPKATVILQFWFPDAEHRSPAAPGSAVDTPEGRIVARIWQLSLADRLTEEYYDAQLAGLNAGCGSTTVGLNVSFSGYSDKLPVFVGEVLAKIRDFDGPSESEFARALDNLRREQASFDVQQPFAHAAYFSRLATFCPEYSIEDLRKATSKADSRADVSSKQSSLGLLRSAEQGFFGQAIAESAVEDMFAFIFMLAVRDVSAARDSFNVAEMVTLAANTMEQSSQFHEHMADVAEHGSFSLKTMWAKGKENPLLGSLHWANATITFSYESGGEGQPEKYVEVRGMDTKYRILPDAIVMTKEMKTMAVVGISGWQAFDGRSWGPSKYSKDEMLWIRTERNPIIGVTTSSTIPWRYAGYPVYRKGTEKPYYLYNGVQSTIDINAVTMAPEETSSEVHVEVEGQSSKPLNSPDTELVAMVDAMLGQSSCLNSPSLCAFRCFYDSDDDVCGPLAFCKKVTEGETPTALAPFGNQQKCKAVGGSTHEEADSTLETKAIPELKMKALDVVKKLEDLEAVSASSAGRSSMKMTAELWEEAADVLQVFETLPSRTDPEVGKFTAAHRRASKTDMKHWRHRKDRLTIEEYNLAKASSVAVLQGSEEFSVPAKLHSELVNFVLKRPRIIIETAKLESKDKCVLKDESLAEKEQLKEFMNYFMKVPGYNAGDLEGQTLNLPEHCQDYLKKVSGSSMADLLSTADEAAAHMETATNPPDSRTASSLELKSERLLAAVSRDEEARVLLHSDSWTDESEAARTQFVFILLCIIVAIVCFVVAGFLFAGAIAGINSCGGDSYGSGSGCQAFFVCGILGGLVIFGAFCMAWPVGLAVLIGLFVAGIATVVSKSMLEKPEPNMKASKLHRAAAQLHLALIHGNLRAKAAQDILSALDLLPFRGASAPTSSSSTLLRSRFACLDAGQVARSASLRSEALSALAFYSSSVQE